MSSKHGKPDFLELVKSDRRAPPKPPRLLAAIQQNLEDACERLLEQLFAATDDVFYDLSKRASSNSEENLYFESMREVRIAKQGIKRHFLQNMGMNFSHLLENRQPAAQQDAHTFSAQSLAIIDGDDLEVDLALTGMATRARDMYREPLYELVTRLNHLLLQAEIQTANNPLDPNQIASAFIDACADTLNIDIKARLIIFKLFEKHLLKQLHSVYTNANQLLIEAGILPKVPRRVQPEAVPAARSSDAGVAQEDSSPQEHARESGQEHCFKLSASALASLLANARSTHNSAASPVFNCYIFATSNPGPTMEVARLTALLSRAQLLADRQLAKGPRNILPEIIGMLLSKADASAPQALKQNDEDIINLVSLFFDQVLADDNLPLPVYALICRLQIPILKMALKDRHLFSEPAHPARELVNTITEAGISFDNTKQLERDAVYRKISDIVHTICRESKADASIFAEQHRDLKALIQAEQRKTHIVEKRTSQSAAGRARIRSAKVKSQNLLYRKLEAVYLPAEVAEFLTTAWLQVLIITQLKHGCDSAEWAAAGATAGELIWLCQKHEDVRSLQRREELQPLLMKRIEAGLEAAIENPDVRQARVGDLQVAVNRINSGADDVAYQPLTDEHKAALGRCEPCADTATLVSPEGSPIPVGSEFLDQARRMPEGTWVEYLDQTTGEKLRYKLAAKIDSDAYIFVNRKGFKTLERSCEQFARDLQHKVVRPLACGVFFDRLMNKVLSQISQAA